MCPEFDRDLTELEKPFYEPIGIYIFRFGSLERKMDESISELMGIDFHSIGQYPLSEIDFLSKARLFKVFALKKEPQGKDHIDQFFADVETQNTFRNDLVHGSWGIHTSTDDGTYTAWQKISLSRRHKYKTFSVTKQQILINAKNVEVLTNGLVEMTSRFMVAAP